MKNLFLLLIYSAFCYAAPALAQASACICAQGSTSGCYDLELKVDHTQVNSFCSADGDKTACNEAMLTDPTCAGAATAPATACLCVQGNSSGCFDLLLKSDRTQIDSFCSNGDNSSCSSALFTDPSCQSDGADPIIPNHCSSTCKSCDSFADGYFCTDP